MADGEDFLVMLCPACAEALALALLPESQRRDLQVVDAMRKLDHPLTFGLILVVRDKLQRMARDGDEDAAKDDNDLRVFAERLWVAFGRELKPDRRDDVLTAAEAAGVEVGGDVARAK